MDEAQAGVVEKVDPIRCRADAPVEDAPITASAGPEASRLSTRTEIAFEATRAIDVASSHVPRCVSLAASNSRTNRTRSRPSAPSPEPRYTAHALTNRPWTATRLSSPNRSLVRWNSRASVGVSTKVRTAPKTGPSWSAWMGGTKSEATVASGSPLRWNRYTAWTAWSAPRHRRPMGKANIAIIAGTSRIRKSATTNPSVTEPGRGSIQFGQRRLTQLELSNAATTSSSSPVRSLRHGLPSAPVLHGHQPLLRRRGPHARVQGRRIRHALRPVPRQARAYQGDGPRLRAHADLGWQDRRVVRHPGLPRGAATQTDILPVGPEGPRGRARELGPPGPRGTGVAVRRDEDPARAEGRLRALGVRRDADTGPRTVARSRDAAGGVPTRYEQTPRVGRGDPPRPRLDPRGAEPRGLRDLRVDFAAPDGRRAGARRVPTTRDVVGADSGARPVESKH